MKFKVHVKPNSKKNEVIRLEDGSYVVRVSVPPIEGKANRMVIELLADYLCTSKRTLSIVSGLSSKIKIVEYLK
jgi:uncharacterized protein (TIGR00251 family)